MLTCPHSQCHSVTLEGLIQGPECFTVAQLQKSKRPFPFQIFPNTFSRCHLPQEEELLSFYCQGHSIALRKKEIPLWLDSLYPSDRFLPACSQPVSPARASVPSLAEQGQEQPLRQARGSTAFGFFAELGSWQPGTN